MVFSMLSWNLSIITGVSAGILVCFVMILLMCTCIRNKSNESLRRLQLFNTAVDQDLRSYEGLKQDVEYGFFRKLSVLSANNLKICNSKLKPCKSANYTNIRERSVSENELLDSLDDSNSFEYAVLRVDDLDTDVCHIDTISGESDETLSCLSNESKFTAYSTFTLTRGSSFAGTMKSAQSDPDMHI